MYTQSADGCAVRVRFLVLSVPHPGQCVRGRYRERPGEVADRSKLGVVAFGHVCPLSAADRLVTDAPAEDTADLEGPGFIVQRV